MNKIDIQKQDCIYIYICICIHVQTRKTPDKPPNFVVLFFSQYVHYFINHRIGPTVRTALPALLAIFTRGLRFASKASGGAVVL